MKALWNVVSLNADGSEFHAFQSLLKYSFIALALLGTQTYAAFSPIARVFLILITDDRENRQAIDIHISCMTGNLSMFDYQMRTLI